MLQAEHSAILSNFIKLPFVIKIFVLSIFEWPFYTGLLYDISFWTFLSLCFKLLSSLLFIELKHFQTFFIHLPVSSYYSPIKLVTYKQFVCRLATHRVILLQTVNTLIKYYSTNRSIIRLDLHCSLRQHRSLEKEIQYYLSRDMRFPTMWYVRPANPQISLRIRAV